MSPPHDLHSCSSIFCFYTLFARLFGVFTPGRISAAFLRWTCVAGFNFRRVTAPVSIFLVALISRGLVRSDAEKLGAQSFWGGKGGTMFCKQAAAVGKNLAGQVCGLTCRFTRVYMHYARWTNQFYNHARKESAQCHAEVAFQLKRELDALWGIQPHDRM